MKLFNKSLFQFKNTNITGLEKIIKIVEQLTPEVSSDQFTTDVSKVVFTEDLDVISDIKYGLFIYIISHKESVIKELNSIIEFYKSIINKDLEKKIVLSNLFSDTTFKSNLDYVNKNLFEIDFSNKNYKSLTIIFGQGNIVNYHFTNTEGESIIINSQVIKAPKPRYTFVFNNPDFSISLKNDIGENANVISFDNKHTGMVRSIKIGLKDFLLEKNNFSFYKERLSDNYSSGDSINCLIAFTPQNNGLPQFSTRNTFFKNINEFLDYKHPLIIAYKTKETEAKFNILSAIYNSNFDLKLISEDISDILYLNDIEPKYQNKYDKVSEKTLSVIKKFEIIREEEFYNPKKITNYKPTNT